MPPVISCTAVFSCTQHFRRCTYAGLRAMCMWRITMICRTHHLSSNKAVADGAVSSYIDPLVTSRTSKYTYGVECFRAYDRFLSDHRERAHTQFTALSGGTALPNAFSSILKRVCTGYQLCQLIVQSSTGCPSLGEARIPTIIFFGMCFAFCIEQFGGYHSCIPRRSSRSTMDG